MGPTDEATPGLVGIADRCREEADFLAIKLGLQVIVPAAEADATKLRINLAIRRQFAAARIRFLQEANRVWSEAETG